MTKATTHADNTSCKHLVGSHKIQQEDEAAYLSQSLEALLM